MNAIDYALNNLFQRIPSELITQAFGTSPVYGYIDNRSLEQRVRETVIDSFVSIDCNLVGGQQVMLPMSTLPGKPVETGWIYEIPLAMTQGRKITSVLGVEYSSGNGNLSNPDMNAMGRSLMDMVNFATGPSGGVASGNVMLVGPNTVFVGSNMGTGSLYLRCMIANDSQMANLNPRALPIFAQLCEYACKGMIYNALRIKLGEGSITGGSLNSYLNQILDEYSDSFTLYNELRDGKWKKVSILADDFTRRELTRMSLPRS